MSDEVDLDAAPSTVAQATTKAAATIGQLVQVAHTAGVREGMEVSAQIVEICIGILDGIDMHPVMYEATTSVLADVRDRIRTEALALEDPKPFDPSSKESSDA